MGFLCRKMGKHLYIGKEKTHVIRTCRISCYTLALITKVTSLCAQYATISMVYVVRATLLLIILVIDTSLNSSVPLCLFKNVPTCYAHYTHVHMYK